MHVFVYDLGASRLTLVFVICLGSSSLVTHVSCLGMHVFVYDLGASRLTLVFVISSLLCIVLPNIHINLNLHDMLIYCFCDAPTPGQFGFQDPGTGVMESIIDLHHDIMVFLIAIFTLVVGLGGSLCVNYHYKRNMTPQKFNHHASLELFGTFMPAFLIFFLSFPSLTLIYSFDHFIEQPALTVKVIGFQGAGIYELKEHVTSELAINSNILDID